MNEHEENTILVALGRIEGKQDTFHEYMKEEIVILKDRVTTIEREIDRKNGQISGIKFLWEFLRTLPVGLVAFFMGKGKIDL